MPSENMPDLLPPPPSVSVAARSFAPSEAALARADAAIVVLDRSGDLQAQLGRLPRARTLRARLADARRHGQEFPLLTVRLDNRRQTLLVVGFARPLASGFERLELAGKLARESLRPGVGKLQLHAVGLGDAARLAALEAVLSAVLAHAAPMPQQKSKPVVPCDLASVEIGHGADAAFDRAVAIAEGNHLARWLTVLPPNLLDSIGYRDALRQLAQREGWSFKFHDVAALEKMGAGAFVAVARANDHRAAGIVRLTRRPGGRAAEGAPRIALVGKGICFDTGGINLKPHKGMFLMHGDMQGSAVAVGTLLALERLDSPCVVDCWLAITENQIGPNAFRPQDIVRALNGTTIQVVHSDAEGRMVLADALTLASREEPGFVLDFATLTGACVNALTERYAGAFSNRAALHDPLQRVGRDCGERVWCFPMDDDYDTDLDSTVADVQQCTADSKGDHILAARFLSKFVAAGVPWVHVDLAPAERKGGLGHVPTEFTGFGVRYAVHLLGEPAEFLDRLQDLT
jgi:leucyl aminopeptidase